MRRFLTIALLSVAALRCATTPAPATADAPEIRITQLPPSEFEVQQQGADSIAYSMTVKNRSAEPITLKQIEMKTVGRSPYVLKTSPVPLDEKIDPGAEKVVPFSMWAYPNSTKAGEMVWVQGTATFEGTKGSFKTPFAQSFRRP